MKREIIEVNTYAKTVLRNELFLQESNTLTILLPGNNYTIWGPVLYYATNLSFELGFDTLLIEYGYQKTNRDYDKKNYDDIIKETYEAIELAFKRKKYEKIIIIGKSFGTSIASHFIEKIEKDHEVILVGITPTQKGIEGLNTRKSIVIVGDKDPYVSYDDLKALKKKENIKVHIVQGAAHDLDVGSVEKSIEEMRKINIVLKDYLIKSTN